MRKKALEMELAAKNIFSLYHKAFKTMNLDLLSDSVCYSTKALVLNVEELQVVSESMISSSLKKKKMNTTMQVVQICLLFRMRSNVIGLESALNNNFATRICDEIGNSYKETYLILMVAILDVLVVY